jgi:type II secretory pathway pseudopilin PulG
MKFLIQIVLWVIIGALGYLLFNSVYAEVKFNKVKEARYKAAITNLRDIRAAQLAHKTATGKYEGDFNKLVKFIDTAHFTLTARRDSTVLDKEQTRRFQVDTYKGIIIIDTLGTRSIKDSLFKGSDRYKTMINIPIEGLDAKYELQAGTIEKSTGTYPVFEAKVSKDVLLWDQPKDNLNKEKQVISVDGVNGDALTVGSMLSINTNGNWPKSYGANDE